MPDLRSADRRRGDALVELVRRAVASADEVPTTTKAQVFVTIDWDRLKDEVRAGTVVAGPGTGTGAGDVLSASTVRKMACDGGILPTVLGSQGQPVDLVYLRRCFTAGQIKTLWLRDGGCSMPGCTIPATWTDAHHLVHWADGGRTDIGNAALLCGHHHTVVHERRLAGRVDPGTGHVVWDLAPGSYDTGPAQSLHPPGDGDDTHTDSDQPDPPDPPERT